MNLRPLVILAVLIFWTCHVSAATYSVATTGRDTNAGTSTAPFRTLQRALDVARPGDTIRVLAGTYRGRSKAAASGTSSARIIIEGLPGAILDGGDVVRGFVAAPEIGAGVFKHTSMPYIPWSMTWDNKYILRLVKGDNNSAAPAAVTAKMREFFAKPATDSWWNGIEAMYTYVNGVCYVRFRHGQNPDTQDVTFAPGTVDNWQNRPAVIELDGKSFYTIKGLYIRNADAGITLLHDANDNIIENCYFTGGKANIIIGDDYGRGDRNTIRYNQFTVNYVYPDFGHPWTDPLHHHIWDTFKGYGFGDRVAIYIWGSNDTTIHSNHFFRVWDGIGTKDTANTTSVGKRLKVYNNIFHNTADDAMGWGASEIDGQFRDNLLYSHNAIRISCYAWIRGPLYIYRNRFYHPANDARDDGLYIPFYSPAADPEVFIYHNSFSSSGPGISPSLPKDRPARIWVMNNILSTAAEPFLGWKNGDYWYIKGFPQFDYNWCGGPGNGLVGRSWVGARNIIAINARFWSPPTSPNFRLTSTSPLRAKGIDLSRTFTIGGKSHVGGLPGMSSGYFSGAAPDLGAVQFGKHKTVAAPSGLTAARVASKKVKLDWLDHSSNETRFSIERSENGTIFTPVGQSRTNVPTFTDVFGLKSGKKYWYRIRALSFSGAWVSGYSNAVSVTP